MNKKLKQYLLRNINIFMSLILYKPFFFKEIWYNNLCLSNKYTKNYFLNFNVNLEKPYDSFKLHINLIEQFLYNSDSI